MPKIRALHPDFWTDDAVVSVQPLARLLFQGLWNHACDNGHVRNRPRQLKLRILPADDCSITALLDELADAELVDMGSEWIHVRALTRRQKPDRRYFTTCAHEGCEEPEATTSQRESRRAHGTARRATDGRPGDARSVHATDGDGDGDGDGDEEPGLTPAATPRADVEALCTLLADRVQGNGSKRPSITKRWRDAARLMLDADGRTLEEATAAIEWCQRDEFWRGVVLSMPKLREKYDQMRIQAERRSSGGARRHNEIDWDLAMDRARGMGGDQ